VDAPGLFRRPAARRDAPSLDAHQRRVVEHAGGPVLVLAGPGTGKTTTLVEAVVHRVQERGLAPEQVLLLTFSRKAAQELRERVTARLGRTTRGALAMTFHSYAYALLRRELGGPDGAPLRLLSGPEQDLEVRRLLEGEVLDGGVRWPAELRGALGLRGFRQELRDLLLRAQERGVGPDRLAALGRERGRPGWVAAAWFLRDYESRFDLDPFAEVLDYAGLVRTAAALLEDDDELRRREREARAVVLVDEYQDTDPAQVRLLRALAGDGRDLVAVGDPDQSIYAFRGADVRGVLDFPDRFRTSSGRRAPQVELLTCRRSGEVLLAASRSVAARLPAGRLGPGFRALAPGNDSVGRGRVEVRLAPTPTGEAALIADVLRRAHLHDGVPWSDMAVLLRSTPRSLAGLRRGLLSAGVPVIVPGDELPLGEEPVVRALLDLLQAALRPDRLDGDAVLALLGGPLVRADPLAVRRLRRALREAELTAGADLTGGDCLRGDLPGGDLLGGDLLVRAVRAPLGPAGLPERPVRPLTRLRALLVVAREAAGVPAAEPLPEPLPAAPVEDVLWAVWEGCGLATRLADASRHGGARGAVADRALDAVIALFDAAARYVDRLPGASTLGFLDDVAAQEVPGDTLAQRTPEGDAVRVLTAHASKGLEWRLVVVAGVQEGVWPNLRRRGSLLGADELSGAHAGLPDDVDRRADLLAEERRLFYVAVTRARERLVVTAVAGGEGGADRPSRFLEELGVDLPATTSPVGRPFTGAGLVAELRHVAATSADPDLVEAACRRLARLVEGDDAAPAVGPADPERWWGLAPLSDAAPLVADGEIVRLSPSKVESFDLCALRWFLQSGVGVSGGSGPPQVLGSVVHALCELASGPQALTRAELEERLDRVLPELDLGAPWAARRRRREALQWLDKFLTWQAASTRTLVGTELDVTVPLGPGAELRGRVDRLERDERGRAVVVDLKTSTSAPRADELARHPQLGAYQLAAQLGAFAGHGLEGSGGAALLQLKKNAKATEQLQPALEDDEDPGWAGDLVQRVVTGMGGSTFPAQVNEHCERCPVRACCPLWPEGEGVLR
jgi:superfamily I DNA/RNA helicase/RecB family exonuclease